ncbi:hypothetical protein TNIN_216441 [Trichonephila inaurata madagascariensis]|uniref:Uncharacterized protein n=1 Tax=Trichonephila inaurata madagascariensis TaxID=2747483 RepID=A0A8X7CAK4_9ARAC|nr:hypothetical protein TNIN_216441 [Trichonephila inaurata madagascariensis]
MWKLRGRVLQMSHLSKLAIVPANWTFPERNCVEFFSWILKLWGYIKHKVYAKKPETIRQLKQNIRDEILSLQPETLRAVMKNASKRANLCIEKKGGHLSVMSFHKIYLMY